MMMVMVMVMMVMVMKPGSDGDDNSDGDNEPCSERKEGFICACVCLYFPTGTDFCKKRERCKRLVPIEHVENTGRKE